MGTVRRWRHELSKTGLRAPLVWARHRGLGPKDAFVGSYPRSGSTWLRFLLLECLTGQSSAFGNVNHYIPDVGHHRAAGALLPGGGRLIKTHEPYREEYRKALYLVRDVRDVLLSEHAYHKALGFAGDELDAYMSSFLRGTVSPFGSWQNHVNTWLDAGSLTRNELLVIRFEDLRRNAEETLAGILEFLGAGVDPKVIREAVANNSVERMRAKEVQSPQKASKQGRFIRSGSVGGWRGRLSDGQLELIWRYAGSALERLGYPGASSPAEKEPREPLRKPS